MFTDNEVGRTVVAVIIGVTVGATILFTLKKAEELKMHLRLKKQMKSASNMFV